MKITMKIVTVLVAAVFLIAPSIASTETLNLVQKDPTTWLEIEGGAATMTYTPSGPEFVYNISGTVPPTEKDKTYALIYYKDQTDPKVNWGKIGAIINDNIVPDATTGEFEVTGAINIGTIPQADDFNYPNGAKIWLIPVENINYSDMSMAPKGWYPSRYLFEENLRDAGEKEIPGTSHLITYTDTGDSETGETLDDVTPPAEVSDLEVTAVTDHTITWSWTNPPDDDFVNTVITVYLGVGTDGPTVPGYDHKKQDGTPDAQDGITVTGLASSTSYTILVQTEDNE